MSDAEPVSSLPATTVRVLLHRIGRGNHARSVRRLFTFDRFSGLFNELETAYLDSEHPNASLNAQIAVVADLQFFRSWCALRRARDSGWVPPEHRAAADQMPVTRRETKDFARWCQRRQPSLANAINASSTNVHLLPGDGVVSTQFRNRRLRNASKHLQWLVTQLSTADESNVEEINLIEVRRQLVARWFEKELLPDSKLTPVRSLHPEQAQTFRKAVAEQTVFPITDIGTRDKLVLMLLDQGLRSGELLKLRVVDVNDGYKLDLGRAIGVVVVTRRPNELDDSRAHEPAVKTRPGILPIPRSLAAALVEYVIGPRRDAVDACANTSETPYLFVNHSGRTVGHPLTQRNLNRLVAKLKGRFGLPDEFSPHMLRHTHFTELYDDHRKKGKGDKDIQALLLDRGRWAPNSQMPARYTARSLMRESADYVEERDRQLTHG